jgi:hypothetical protein
MMMMLDSKEGNKDIVELFKSHANKRKKRNLNNK